MIQFEAGMPYLHEWSMSVTQASTDGSKFKMKQPQVIFLSDVTCVCLLSYKFYKVFIWQYLDIYRIIYDPYFIVIMMLNVIAQNIDGAIILCIIITII